MARTKQTAKKTTGGAARRVALSEQHVARPVIPRLASMRPSRHASPEPVSSLQVSVYHWHV